jgi:hypothetical protein
MIDHIQNLLLEADKLIADNNFITEDFLDALEKAKNYYNVKNKLPHPADLKLIVKEIETSGMENGLYVEQNENQHYGVVIDLGDDVAGLKKDDVVVWFRTFGELLQQDGEDFRLGHCSQIEAVFRNEM